jgi:hypothetical protein
MCNSAMPGGRHCREGRHYGDSLGGQANDGRCLGLLISGPVFAENFFKHPLVSYNLITTCR